MFIFRIIDLMVTCFLDQGCLLDGELLEYYSNTE